MAMRLFVTLLFLLQSHVALAVQFTIMGDMPYGSDSQTLEKYNALIRQINSAGSEFAVHVGDIKSGSSMCSDEMYRTQKEFFSKITKPFIYTPGDNEWTDCSRLSNGSFDPLERLDKIREIFFDTQYFNNNTKIGLVNQSEFGKHPLFIENQQWTAENTLFVTIHIVGSNNNLGARDEKSSKSFLARNKANQAWLSRSFEKLKTENRDALVIIFHADPFTDWFTPNPTNLGTGFTEIIENTLLPLGLTTNKPIFIFHGDTHIFRQDRPFVYQGIPVKHIQRIVVPGAADMRALFVDIEPNRNPMIKIEPLSAN
jgi:hypothetical protein